MFEAFSFHAATYGSAAVGAFDLISAIGSHAAGVVSAGYRAMAAEALVVFSLIALRSIFPHGRYLLRTERPSGRDE